MDKRLNFIEDERKHIVRENEQLWEYLPRFKCNSMKYNLIFESLPQETGKTTETVVKHFVKEKLELDDDNRYKPRGIIARFSCYEDHERVRNAVPDKLKGTTYSVYQHYPKEFADRILKKIKNG